jgi:hypothetical protein
LSDLTGSSSRLAAAVAGFVLLGVGLAAGILLLSQPGAPLNPPPQLVGIDAVTVLGNQELIAVGSTRGHWDPAVVARSNDGGEEWRVNAVPLSALTHVAASGTRLVASRYCLPPSAGGQALEPAPTSCLFASDDDGMTWRDLDVGTLVDPTFSDGSYGWAHAQFPNGSELFETSDGGLSWTLLDAPCPADKPLLYRAAATGHQNGYVVCLGVASGAGQAWTLIERSASGEVAALFGGNMSGGEPRNGLRDEFVRGFSMRPDGSGFIWTSKLYETTDGGRSWRAVPTPGLDGGSFGDGGFVIDSNNAYFVWGTTSSSSIVEYRFGILRVLVTWPWSIVADGPRPIELLPLRAELAPSGP